MSPDPVTVVFDLHGAMVCPGGQLTVAVVLTNIGDERVLISTPRLLLSGGVDKWQVAQLADVDVARVKQRRSRPR